MQIRFIAKAGKHDEDYAYLFDRYKYSEEDFTEYLDDDLEYLVKEKGLRNGIMSFEIIEGVLHTITTYDFNVELTEQEILLLEEYTQGQWSDGIGEGFEQFSYFETDEEEELYLSPWFFGQTVKYEIIN